MDVDAGRNLRTTPRRRAARSIVKARHGTRVSRATRDADAQGQARRYQTKKNRRAWDWAAATRPTRRRWRRAHQRRRAS